MTIYCIYCGTDKKSYLAELDIVDSYDPAVNLLVPSPGWRTINRPPGSFQDFHPARQCGSMTIVLQGELEIGASAGTPRQVTLRKGDMLVVIDTQGDGHTAARKGSEQFKAINVRISPHWASLHRVFSGWPDNVLPFAE